MKARVFGSGAVALATVGLLLALMVGLRSDAVAQPRQAASAFVVLHSATITNSNGIAVEPVTLEATFDSLTVQAGGIVSGLVNFEGTVNGATWVAVPATNISSGSAAITTTQAGVYRLTVTGLRAVRARVSGIITNTTDAIGVVGYFTAP